MSTLLPLLVTIIALDFLSLVTPGQDFAMVTRNTMNSGKQAGMFTALGIACSVMVHIVLCIAGVSYLIAQSPDALAVIKTLGALYLIYIGTQFIKNAKNPDLVSHANIDLESSQISSWKAFKIGFIADLVNVEVVLFVVSVFTVIVPVETPLWQKLIISGVIFLDNFLWFAFITHVFSLKKIRLWFQTYSKRIEQVTGVVLMFLGFRAISETKS